jgi:hypothetical protein
LGVSEIHNSWALRRFRIEHKDESNEMKAFHIPLNLVLLVRMTPIKLVTYYVGAFHVMKRIPTTFTISVLTSTVSTPKHGMLKKKLSQLRMLNMSHPTIGWLAVLQSFVDLVR